MNLPALKIVPEEIPEETLSPADTLIAQIKEEIAAKFEATKAAREKPLDDGQHDILGPGNQLQERVFIANGLKNGVCERYTLEVLTLKATYINGIKDGPAIAYDIKGQMIAKMFYRQDKLNGVYETYEKGKITSMGMYENDKPNGLRINFDQQGNVQTKEPKVNGETHGVVETYDKVGRLAKTVEFVKGIKHGYQKTFYPDGTTLLRIEEYRDGIQEGTDRSFYPDGTLKAETQFLQGKITLARVDYAPDGKVMKK